MLGRNVAVGLLGGAVFWAFWSSRAQWDPEMRLWKAFGDGAFALLALTLAIGPVARLWAPARRLLPWRRQTGVWFALLATVHAVLVFNGWARWSIDRFLGYEFVPQLGRSARLEPGFGLANLIGILALFWALVLLATSSDRALRYLGGQAWKWLHSGAYIIFYLSVAHTAYFLFIHFTLSFHREVPPPDWFRIPFLVIAGSVVSLQAAAFAKTGRRRPSEPREGRRTASRDAEDLSLPEAEIEDEKREVIAFEIDVYAGLRGWVAVRGFPRRLLLSADACGGGDPGRVPRSRRRRVRGGALVALLTPW